MALTDASDLLARAVNDQPRRSRVSTLSCHVVMGDEFMASQSALSMGDHNGIPQQSAAMSLAKRIVEARKARGWDRMQLAEASGVPYPTLAGLETSDQKSSTATPMLASALNVNALWLATGKGQRDVNAGQQPAEMVATSQTWELGRATLARALWWFEIEDGRRPDPAQSLRRAERLIALYREVETNGGDLSTATVLELTETARRQEQKGSTHGRSGKRGTGN